MALAARGIGAAVRLVSAVGRDEAGVTCRDHLRATGIDADLYQSAVVPTETRIILTEPTSRRSLARLPGASADLPFELVLAAMDQLRPDDVVVLGDDALVDEQIVRRAHHRGARIVLQLTGTGEPAHEVLTLSDPVVTDEHGALRLADAGVMPTSLLVTFGLAGAAWGELSCLGDPEWLLEPTAPGRGRGWGETFTGALAGGLAQGWSRAVALEQSLLAARRVR